MNEKYNNTPNYEKFKKDEHFLTGIRLNILESKFPELAQAKKNADLQAIKENTKIKVDYSKEYNELDNELSNIKSFKELENYCILNDLNFPDYQTLEEIAEMANSLKKFKIEERLN